MKKGICFTELIIAMFLFTVIIISLISKVDGFWEFLFYLGGYFISFICLINFVLFIKNKIKINKILKIKNNIKNISNNNDFVNFLKDTKKTFLLNKEIILLKDNLNLILYIENIGKINIGEYKDYYENNLYKIYDLDNMYNSNDKSKENILNGLKLYLIKEESLISLFILDKINLNTKLGDIFVNFIGDYDGILSLYEKFEELLDENEIEKFKNYENLYDITINDIVDSLIKNTDKLNYILKKI